jgi:hypothetical protein
MPPSATTSSWWIKRLNEPYHLLAGSTPESFAPITSSTFVPTQNPTELNLTFPVSVTFSRYLRAAAETGAP